MSPRSHPSALKRRKEVARQEKQRDKAQRKAQRKQEKVPGQPGVDDTANLDDMIEPQDDEWKRVE